MAKPVVAIVGRPNVGKAMLFNKLTGRRTAIVEDTPGVTRDRIYGLCDWNGRTFDLIDTGGIEPSTDSQMLLFMRRQAEIAIEVADVIIMVTDVRVGMTAADQEVATMLKRSKKPVVVAVNKCDAVGPVNPEAYEFYGLGLGDPIEVSRRRRRRKSTRISSRSPLSASRMSANPACSIRFSAMSGSSSPTSPGRRGMPSTRIMKTNRAATCSSTPPGCAASPRWMTPSSAIPICAPSRPSTAAMSA